MVACVFRLFGFWEIGKRAGGSASGACPGSPSAYAEALEAGWVTPFPEIEVRAEVVRPEPDESCDIGAFLDRVYRNQQC